MSFIVSEIVLNGKCQMVKGKEQTSLDCMYWCHCLLFVIVITTEVCDLSLQSVILAFLLC